MAARLEEKKHLSAKGLLQTVRQCFSKVFLPKKQGAGKEPEIPLKDCLMSGLAVFSLKFPSLLQFDQSKNEEIIRHNLETMYEVQRAPCDTQMRERLDQVPPEKIRGAFKKVFSCLQRGKVLEKYQFIDEHYLLLAELNAPHLRLCQKLNIRFITEVKPDGNKSLFEWLKGVEREKYEIFDDDGNCIHRMEFYNGVPLNDADPDLEVNYVEYWEFDSDRNQIYHNTWITDLEVTRKNVLLIVKGGRARWKVENETFNTLKNQGYKFEHNYGHGTKHLSTIFGMLMMLTFLIDQAQQLCCGLFQGALKKCRAKIVLWEKIRNAFQMFKVTSWMALYKAIMEGFSGCAILDTS